MRRVLIALTALLATAAPAGAEPFGPLGKRNVDYLRFAGDRLIAGNDRRLDIQESPSGAFRTVHSTPQGEDLNAVIDSIDATATRIAFVTFGSSIGGEGGGDLEWSSLRAGPLDGPFALRSGFEDSRAGPERLNGPQATALADGGIAVIERGTVRWLADDGSTTTLAGVPQSAGLSGAGRYIGVDTGDLVDVYDVTTRQRVFRYRIPGFVFVRADGGVTAYDGRQLRVLTAGPAAPEPVVRAEKAAPVAHHGDTLYIRRPVGELLAELRAIDLAMGTERVLSPALPSQSPSIPLFALSPTRLAYYDITTGCVYAGELPATAPANWPVGRGCRPRIVFDPSGQIRRGRVKATLACPGTAQDTCSGRLEIRVRERRWRRVASRAFALSGGAERAYSVRVPRYRRGRRAQLRLVAGDDSTADASPTSNQDLYR